jgi:hypothetical protein
MGMMKFWRRLRGQWAYFVALALLFIAVAPASADIGNIRVAIANEEGRPLPAVSITAESRNGDVRKATTDEVGVASLAGLEAGLYRITASIAGYTNVVEPSLRVVRDKTVPLRLQLRAVDEGMDEVLVVAKAIRTDAFGAVSSTFLDREDLRTAVGSGADVLRALDGLPGLVSTGEFASFTVRGRGPRDNLILVDGLPYDKVVHFDQSLGEQEDINGGGRFSIFPPTLIEGAEFSPGGWTAAYGGRNGSLLQLDVAQGNPSPSASLRIDLAGYEAIYDGPSGFHDDTSLIFTARRFDFGQFFETIDEEDIGSPVLTDVILKTHTQLNARNELEFLFLFTPETYERDVENVLASEDFQERELVDTEQDAGLLGITWSRLIGDDGRWENRFYFRDSDKTSREGEAFPDSEPMIMPPEQVPVREEIITLDENETEIGWRSDFADSNRWGEFSVGLRVAELDLEFATTLTDDWIRYQYDSDDFRPDPNQRYIVLTPGNTNSAFARSELQYAAYAEQVFAVGQWDLRAGLRYDYDGFSDDGYISPRLSANYRFSPTTRLSMTAGTFYQSPRFLDRAADPANFNLANEKTNHVSLGVNRRLGENWDLLVEAYYQQLRDLVTEPDRVTGLATNDGDGTSYGLDVVVNRRFAEGWSANAVYSFNDATLDDNDGNGDYDAPFNHEHLFSIGAKWEISERWLVGFRWKYATGRPRDDFIIYDDVLADIGGPLRYSEESISNGTLRWDDYHQLNIRADYRRPLGPVDFIAFLDVLNVYGSPPSDQREFNSATGELKKDDEGVTPLIGIRFEKTWQ